jgi:hypothetical protein
MKRSDKAFDLNTLVTETLNLLDPYEPYVYMPIHKLN